MEVAVIKAGGSIVQDDTSRRALLTAVATSPTATVLVHGGGNLASRLTRQLGREPKLVDGRRITSAEDLEVAVMAYAGWTNKLLVAGLQALGCDAVGLSGADANVLLAVRRPPTPAGLDFGFVGDLKTVNHSFLRKLMEAAQTPVLCAISHDGAGQLLNTNADTIAATVAIALAQAGHRVRLKSVLDKPGVLQDAADDRTVLSELSEATYLTMRSAGAIHTGMLPKLDTGYQALRGGVCEVRVCGINGLLSAGGTRLVSEA